MLLVYVTRFCLRREVALGEIDDTLGYSVEAWTCISGKCRHSNICQKRFRICQQSRKTNQRMACPPRPADEWRTIDGVTQWHKQVPIGQVPELVLYMIPDGIANVVFGWRSWDFHPRQAGPNAPNQPEVVSNNDQLICCPRQ